MRRSRARTSSKDADFFLNDQFGFLAPKISKSPIGRAVYGKAGYPLIGKREIKQPEFKEIQYNIKPKKQRKSRRTKSMGNRAFSKSLNTRNKTSKNTGSPSTARYKSSINLTLKQRRSLPPRNLQNDPPLLRPQTMLMDINTLPETKEFLDKKVRKYFTQHSDSNISKNKRKRHKRNHKLPQKHKRMPQYYYPSAFSGIYGCYTTKMAPFEDSNMIIHKKDIDGSEHYASKKNGTYKEGDKSNKKKRSKKIKKKKSIKDKGIKKNNKYINMTLVESGTVSTDDGHNASDHELFVLKKQMILEPINDNDNDKDERDPFSNHHMLIHKRKEEKQITDHGNDGNIFESNHLMISRLKNNDKDVSGFDAKKTETETAQPIPIHNEEDPLSDHTLLIRKTEDKHDVEMDSKQFESSNRMISTVNDEKDAQPILSLQDDKTVTEQKHVQIIPTSAKDDDLSDTRLVICNKDENVKDEQKEDDFEDRNTMIYVQNEDIEDRKHVLPLEQEETKIEKTMSTVPTKDVDLSDSHLIITKKDDNTEDEYKANGFEDSNTVILAQNEDTSNNRHILPLQQQKTKTEKAVDAAPMENDDLSNSHIVITKKEDKKDKEKEGNDFEDSTLVITHRHLQNDDDKKDPFGAENIKMARERELNDDGDAEFASERYRLQQEMEQELKAEEDKYKMRMLAIRQMRERMGQMGSRDKFEEERLLLNKWRDDDGLGFKFPFDFGSFKFGFNLNWITVQYDEVEYNDEGNIILTVHGQKVELPSSKVLKCDESQ